jgi:hypothetical protein
MLTELPFPSTPENEEVLANASIPYISLDLLVEFVRGLVGTRFVEAVNLTKKSPILQLVQPSDTLIDSATDTTPADNTANQLSDTITDKATNKPFGTCSQRQP